MEYPVLQCCELTRNYYQCGSSEYGSEVRQNSSTHKQRPGSCQATLYPSFTVLIAWGISTGIFHKIQILYFAILLRSIGHGTALRGPLPFNDASCLILVTKQHDTCSISIMAKTLMVATMVMMMMRMMMIRMRRRRMVTIRMRMIVMMIAMIIVAVV